MPMNRLNELCEQGRMTWIDAEQGWVAVPEDVLKARRPAGGVWQGLNTRTGSQADAPASDRDGYREDGGEA